MRTRETELRNAELSQSDQFQEVPWQLLRTQDEERRHIARELHDSAGQILSLLSMSLTPRIDSRSLRHLVNALAEFESLSIAFVSLSENLNLTTASGRRRALHILQRRGD
jgi:signal transduction histidine kinase